MAFPDDIYFGLMTEDGNSTSYCSHPTLLFHASRSTYITLNMDVSCNAVTYSGTRSCRGLPDLDKLDIASGGQYRTWCSLPGRISQSLVQSHQPSKHHPSPQFKSDRSLLHNWEHDIRSLTRSCHSRNHISRTEQEKLGRTDLLTGAQMRPFDHVHSIP